MTLMSKPRPALGGILGRGRKAVPVKSAPVEAAPAEAGVSTSAPTEQWAQLTDATGQPSAASSHAAQADEPARSSWLARRRQARLMEGRFESYPHLMALKPKEKYVFRSDYFEVDSAGSVGCVLAFFHQASSHDGFPPLWGIQRIPGGLGDQVTAVVLEQIERKDDKWIDQRTKQSEKLDSLEAGELETSGTTSSRRRARKSADDLDITIGEIQNGASYLHVHHRLLLKAPDLETLDEAIQRLSRLYIERFATLTAAPYAGEQRQELSGLFSRNAKKRGPGFHFTSTELAGSYSLVTNGLNDAGGEYVGFLVGDINNSAVLLDTNGYDHHVVIADNTVSQYLNRAQVSDMWCSKLSQSAMLSNGRVIHLVLDGADLDQLGPKFERLTSRVDLASGDVNMFEMFGEADDELTVFAAQMQKLTLMFEQLHDAGQGSSASIIRSELQQMATQFYIDQRMWAHNAQRNRDKLRVVGLDHSDVPRLQVFAAYLQQAHTQLLHSEKNDPHQLEAYKVLSGIAQNLLVANGDLFNNHTASTVDGIRDARRVVYDFSELMRRGHGIAMAQLVNILSFAIGNLGPGDSVIVHGVEHIDERVKGYVEGQFEQLYRRGGRVVFSYNDIDKMLADSDFNKFDAADFTVLGAMRERSVEEYQRQLHQQIPSDLAQLITKRGEGYSYLRRGVTNVVFQLDLALGVNPNREKQRREMARRARAAEDERRYGSIIGRSDPVPGANATSAGAGLGSNADRRRQVLAERKARRAADKPGKRDKPGRSQPTTSQPRTTARLVPSRSSSPTSQSGKKNS